MNIKTLLSGSITALLLSCSLNAQVLMLDFGPTAASGEWLTKSPYHSAGGSNAHNTWNQIHDATGNFAPVDGLLWSNGDVATGVTVDIGGNASGGSTIIDLQKTGLTSGALGDHSNTDIYGGSSVGTDAIYLGTSGSRAVGLQVAGLSAGNYDIYITARNTNRTGAYVQNLYVGTAGTTDDFDFTESSYVSKQLSYVNSTDAIGMWEEGENYVKFSVTITAGEYLNIAALGGDGEARGFLNSVQIVAAVPEPSTYALIAGLGILGFVAIRRKVRAHRAA